MTTAADCEVVFTPKFSSRRKNEKGFDEKENKEDEYRRHTTDVKKKVDFFFKVNV